MNRKLARRARRQKAHTVTVNKKPLIIIAIVVALLVGILGLLFQTLRSTWDGNTRLSVAILKDSGDMDVIVVDPATNKLVTIEIPGNTVVKAANQMGEWPLSSIGQLAENEGHSNDFIAHTITKTFYFPIEHWATEDALQIVGDNSIQSLLAVLKRFDSDLVFADKVKLAFKSMGIDSVDRYTINLSDSSYLKPQKLIDGNSGYEVTATMPASIASLFADQGVSQERAKIMIVNNTGTGAIARDMSKIVEVMGGKVYSVENGEEADLDCIISGNKLITVTKIASVFNCEIKTREANGYDIVLTIGTSFKNRY